jgi:8-oxo-dGTP diphosphatase
MMVGIIFLRFSTIWRRRRMVIMPALAYLLGPMSYEVECDLLLKRDGKVVLTDLEARLLRSVRDVGSLHAISKRVGMPSGDLLGTLRSLNDGRGREFVSINGDEVDLTSEGLEALLTFELKRKMLDEQMDHMWRKPYLTTDGVLIEKGKVLLVKRGREPAKGAMALPGGIVEYGERLEDCVVREVREETGLDTRVVRLIGVFSDPGRDPRGHFVSALYELERTGGELMAGDDAAETGFYPLDRLPQLAFDHEEMIRTTLRK